MLCKVYLKFQLQDLRFFHNIIYKSECIETNVFAEIALEKSEKISKMSEKIGIILKH